MERALARLILTFTLTGAAAAQAELLAVQGASGDLGYSYRTARYSSGYSTVSNMLSGRVASNAYLWQPWFATLDFSLALNQERASNSNGSESRSHFTTGEFGMSVLPKSSFPFMARYTASDSRVDNSSDNDNPLLALSTARQFSRDNLMLSQGINGRNYRFTLRYNNDEARSDLGEEYVQRGYAADYSQRSAKQNLSAKVLYQTQSNNQNSDESDNTVISLNHNYYPSSYTNLDTLLSHVKSNNYYSTALSGVTQQLTSTIDQASTSLSWRSDARPLRIYSGLRVHTMDYQLDNGTTTTALQSDGLNFNLGASYQFNERVLGSVNGQYGALRNDTSDVRYHNEGAALNYSSVRYPLYSFDYGWHSGLSGSNQQSGESRAQSATLSLGHGASRSWSLERRSSVRLTLNQDLEEGYAHSSGPEVISDSGKSGETRRIEHSINLGWMGSDTAGSSLAQLTLSDSRGVVGDKSHSQMANAQLSRTQLLDNRSSLNGNLTWQSWHYTQEGVPDYGVGQTFSATAGYRYARPFAIQRVVLNSDLRFSDSQPANGPRTQEIYWDNRLAHEIGLMRSSLGLALRDHLGERSATFMLTVKRLF